MEAPLRATFNTKLQGTVSVRWSSSGGTITTPDSVNASILFPAEGEYEVALTASNGKDSLRVTQNITVRKNTNLRMHENIRLGINTARDSLPVCYSTKLRKAFRLDEVTDSIAPLIDIVYMGMNKSFTYNAFVSPDMLSRTPFPEIKGARHTYFVNRIEESPLSLSASQFRAMDNDALLRNKLIRQGEQEEMYFGNAVPRVVLFETYDGRKGAILVKETVSLENNDSYTVVDIKVQKND
jgi:PKD repeat protein